MPKLNPPKLAGVCQPNVGSGGNGLLGCGDSVWKGQVVYVENGEEGCMGWQQVMWPRVFHESLSSFGASGLGEGPGQADWHQEGTTVRGKATGNCLGQSFGAAPHALNP